MMADLIPNVFVRFLVALLAVAGVILSMIGVLVLKSMYEERDQ